MQENTRFYPTPLHGCGNTGLPADREIRQKPPKRTEERA